MNNMEDSSNRTSMLVKGLLPVAGQGEGKIIATDMPISFWGGIDPGSGTIIDRYHPLKGNSVADEIFVLPAGRGSSTGSGVLLEMILSDCAPNGIILREKDEIIILGGIVASEVFLKEIPIIILNDTDFNSALQASYAKIDINGNVTLTFARGSDHDGD